MREAEATGNFDYDPKSKPPPNNISETFKDSNVEINSTRTSDILSKPATDNLISLDTSENTFESSALPPSAPPAVTQKRKNSLDEFELEIEGINLDDNLDTSVHIPFQN